MPVNNPLSLEDLSTPFISSNVSILDLSQEAGVFLEPSSLSSTRSVGRQQVNALFQFWQQVEQMSDSKQTPL
jgi:hypothetical protein